MNLWAAMQLTCRARGRVRAQPEDQYKVDTRLPSDVLDYFSDTLRLEGQCVQALDKLLYREELYIFSTGLQP